MPTPGSWPRLGPLTRFDPKGLFGISMPQSGKGESLYLPSGLAKAMDKMMELQRKESLGSYDKATDLFRFSILGLSPRYTAHILFGGTFLLALRSTPYMPLMLQARRGRAMKDRDHPLRRLLQAGRGGLPEAPQGARGARQGVGEARGPPGHPGAHRHRPEDRPSQGQPPPLHQGSG